MLFYKEGGQEERVNVEELRTGRKKSVVGVLKEQKWMWHFVVLLCSVLKRAMTIVSS